MDNTSKCDVSVGPSDLAESLGLEVVLPCYAAVLTVWSSIFIYALYHKLRSHRSLQTTEKFFIFLPSILTFVTIVPLVSPVLYHLVSLVQDTVCNFGMMLFLFHTRQMLGGEDKLVTEKSSCPVGVPPCCCLRFCCRPKMTRRKMWFIFFLLKLAVILHFVLILVNAGLAYNAIPSPKSATDIGNIPSFMIVPVQISAMFCYKVFISYSEERLRGSFPRSRGRLVLVMFVIGKATSGLFSVLEEKVFERLPGLECVSYAQLLLPIVQLGLILPISFILPRIYTRKWTHNIQDDTMIDELSALGTNSKLVINTTEHNEQNENEEQQKILE